MFQEALKLNFYIFSIPDRKIDDPDAFQQERGDRVGGPAVAQVREGGSPLHQRKTRRIFQKNRK